MDSLTFSHSTSYLIQCLWIACAAWVPAGLGTVWHISQSHVWSSPVGVATMCSMALTGWTALHAAPISAALGSVLHAAMGTRLAAEAARSGILGEGKDGQWTRKGGDQWAGVRNPYVCPWLHFSISVLLSSWELEIPERKGWLSDFSSPLWILFLLFFPPSCCSIFFVASFYLSPI